MDDPVAGNRARQREIYGEPLGERVHRLTTGLGITQSRLASVIGLSPAMLSQLAGARRVKIGDPAVLGRLIALDRRLARGPVPPGDVPALLAEVRAAPTPWGRDGGCTCAAGDEAAAARRVPRPRRPHDPAAAADDALRGVTAPARLVAAAAALAPSFPEIAEVLRRAAARREPRPGRP
ncbi:helix-turn-helix transcriptional regulator [Pseudonocardia sp. C8]|uniref:helix-turn-helix domain-containing protein n=1 Tax=Pseudonocardia sp. C8 TaxID=2762759 RepID=UPI001642617C|nr:helix-turn-helix domain-containing protein [Pseudonocardia sp. C8]MBC3190834.1 helix-turn-helix transcriptional regulator [Pseudonocardia sp. C8]